MAEAIIEVDRLTRFYGPNKALDAVNVRVEKGAVLGLLGANGAGKTTLIKHFLGLLRSQEGTVRVFGIDPVEDPVGVLSRIGYLGEESDLPSWMKVQELMQFTAAFRPTWDAEFAESLRVKFELDPNAKLANLSKGQRARAGLIAALAFHPDLLLLDEPSSGLDPIVRRDILGAIIRTISEEGKTVIFSSHLLSEVEQVCDHIVMLRNGQIVLDDQLDEIKRTHIQITVRTHEGKAERPSLPGGLKWSGKGCEWQALWRGEPNHLQAEVAAQGARLIGHDSASLDEIFVAHAARSDL